MTSWVALIRGINVGGHAPLAMSDLRALLTGLGYDDVRTHLQSGNAAFAAPGARAPALERDIASAIGSKLGLEIKVMVRSGAQLRRVVGDNPFSKKKVGPKELHATFLSKKPAAAKLAAVDPKACLPDEFAFGDRVIYVRLRNGVAGSRLPNWERVLGVSATTRNWNTTTRLLALVDD
jgi:uncharacterized protein (DUF1697 family)